MARMTGAKFMADTLKAYGVTHVFLVPAILRRALAEMDLIGIKRVITHGEKAAAYMADGYARASGKPGICMAQSVGAANLAAGLQDAYLGLSPVIPSPDTSAATSSTGTPTRRSSTPSHSPPLPSSARWWTTPSSCRTYCARPSVRRPQGRRLRNTWTSRA